MEEPYERCVAFSPFGRACFAMIVHFLQHRGCPSLLFPKRVVRCQAAVECCVASADVLANTVTHSTPPPMAET